MSIEITKDYFLKTKAKAMVNTLSCSGKVDSLLYRALTQRIPQMQALIKTKGNKKWNKVGDILVFENPNNKEYKILNFFIREKPESKATMEAFTSCILNIKENYKKIGLTSIAFPPIDIEIGDINQAEIIELITKELGSLEDLDILVYEPNLDPPKTEEVVEQKEEPKQ